MALRFLAILALALSAHAAVPRVSPELPASPVDTLPAPGTQVAPAMASRGEDAFAVWTDYRAGNLALIGSRIAADGTYLDPQGILIDSSSGIEPQIVWNGTEYLILSIGHAPFPYPGGRTDLYLHRLKPDGTPAGPRVHLEGLLTARLYSNGRQAVIVGYKAGVYVFAYLDAEGTLGETMVLPQFTGLAAVPDGDDWIVFRSTQLCDPDCSIKLRQLRIRGTKMVSERDLGLSLIATPSPITAATDGNGHFMVVWSEVSSVFTEPGRYRGGITYVVTDAAGKVIGPMAELDRVDAKFPADARPTGFTYNRPGVTWTGGRFVAVWTWFDGTGRIDVRSMSIGPDGKTARREPYVVHSETQAPLTGLRAVVAVTTSRLHYLWSGEGDLAERSAVSIGELTMPHEPRNPAMSASRQDDAECAAGDDSVFLVWTETTGTTETVRGRLLRSGGAASPVLTMSDAGQTAWRPAVAFSGGVWLVVWSEDVYEEKQGKLVVEGTRRMARRYDRDGVALDAQPIGISSELKYGSSFSPDMTQRISVAGNGSEFLVTWPAVSGGEGDRQLRMARVAADGTVLDPDPHLVYSGGKPFRGEPSAVWTGTDYFLLWRENVNASDVPHHARSTRVSAAGEPGADFPRLITTGDDPGYAHSAFELSSSGTDVLVTWTERHLYTSSRGCVYAQQFTFDGAPSGPKHEVFCGTGPYGIPDGAFSVWDGTRYLVLFSFEDAMWAHPLDGTAPMKLFETTGLLLAARPVATRTGIVLPYTRSATGFGAIRRLFHRTVSFGPPRRRSVK